MTTIVTEPSVRSARLRWASRLLQLLLLALIAWGIIRAVAPHTEGFSWTAVADARPAPGRLSLSTILLVIVYVAHALLWRRIMRDLAVGQPSTAATIRIYFLASLGRYVPGKVWQLAGLALLSKRAGLPAVGATASALLGQFAFLATGCLFLALMLPRWAEGTTARIAGILLVVLAGLGWLVIATPAGGRARAWLRARAGSIGGEQFTTALDLAERIRARDAILWGVWYGLTWALLGLAFTLFVTAFVPGAAADSRQIAGVVAASYLAGYLVLLAPAGIGVREGAMTGLLTAIPAIPLSAAVMIAVVSRIWFTAAELLPLAVIPFTNRNTA
ncbi:MAG: lysylphosphatidylglycerol synthase domain-containing protein [Longimicrobiales bacterium]